MTPGARIQAAIEILADIADHHRPAHEALADWGRSHRFAGSADRAAIGNLVFDALRRRASIAWRMGSEEPRALALGVVCFVWGDRPDALFSRFANDRHAPAVPDAAELQALSTASLDGAPDWVRADVPEWIMPSFAATFGDAAVAEAAALGDRPPLDMRVNTLKTTRERLLQTFARHRAVATPLSPAGVRIAPLPGPTRLPNVQAEPAHAKGWFEIQDEGSQLAAFLVDARPGHQVLDFCAGGGGKSLAFAAAMDNRGQIYAHDADRRRLSALVGRMRRAGTRNIQLREPGNGALDDLRGNMDRVVVDAPCTGTGTWRRRPDARWRVSPQALARRVDEQRAILAAAAEFTKPGGRLVYITCSVLAEENTRQVAAFLDRHREFRMVPGGEVWAALVGDDRPVPWIDDNGGLTLTPARTGTDGFHVAIMERRPA